MEASEQNSLLHELTFSFKRIEEQKELKDAHNAFSHLRGERLVRWFNKLEKPLQNLYNEYAGARILFENVQFYADRKKQIDDIQICVRKMKEKEKTINQLIKAL